MSAFGGKAEVAFRGREDRFWPTSDLSHKQEAVSRALRVTRNASKSPILASRLVLRQLILERPMAPSF